MLSRKLVLAAALLASSLLPAAAQDYPVTTRDVMGREVTIPAQPERIVTTSPSAIELLYAAGGTAIARSSTALGVPGAEDLVDIGNAYSPSVELIVQQAPDLIIADAALQAQLAGMLGGLGAPVLYVGALRYADIPASLRLIGSVIGTAETAEAAAVDAETVAAEVEASVAALTPAKTLVLVAGRDGTLSVALNDSFIGDLVRIAGGDNVAADIPQNGPIPGFAVVSPETIVETDPDVILVVVPGNTGGPSIGAMVAQMLPMLRAVQESRVHEIDLETFLQNPGPRAVAGLPELAKLLHPELP
ncbi:MAG: ABC transporter substrate-binding protein [Bauldia sp.]|nr:ABC transporter substrate-binding protein [Bauldia sp.]